MDGVGIGHHQGGVGETRTVRLGDPSTCLLPSGTVKVVEAAREVPSPMLVTRVVGIESVVTCVVLDKMSVTVTVMVSTVVDGVGLGHGHPQTSRVGVPRSCRALRAVPVLVCPPPRLTDRLISEELDDDSPGKERVERVREGRETEGVIVTVTVITSVVAVGHHGQTGTVRVGDPSSCLLPSDTVREPWPDVEFLIVDDGFLAVLDVVSFWVVLVPFLAELAVFLVLLDFFVVIDDVGPVGPIITVREAVIIV